MTDALTWLTAALALAGVLAVALLLARGVRAAGLAPRLGTGGAGRRLALEESLALDPRRRLLLLRCDGQRVLLLTGPGGDFLVGWLPPEQTP
jgi:flagellar protein FliO/FliZ